MIIRFFKSNSASAFLFLPVVAAAIWIFGFFPPRLFIQPHAMPLYDLTAMPLRAVPWLGTLAGFVLCVGEGFLLNFIVNEQEMLTKKSNLPALFYVVFMSNNSSMLRLQPLLFANLFLLLAVLRILGSYRRDSAFSEFFDAGLLVSIATLFYLPCIVFLPVIGISLVIFRPFNWREWVIAFAGLLVPYIFVFTWYFWSDQLPLLINDKILTLAVCKKPSFDLSPAFYFLITTGWLIVVLSFGSLFSGLGGGGSQKTKKAVLLTLWLFLFSIASVFIAPEVATVYFSLLAIPAAIICANYFLKQKKELLGEILFLLLLGGIYADLLSTIF